MTDNVLQPGQVLQKRYRIKHLIARGGMSEIYLAEHEHTGETVVIKCLPRRLADRPDLVKRFKQECRTYGKLQHPNIVRILDADDLPDGSIYIVMEKLDGRPLRALMPKGQALNPLHALDIIRQLCEALCFAHKKGISHRDIKPDNIMVGENGHVWLLDFGLARWNAPGGLASHDMPHMGTAGYMAPEHAHDRNSMDHRADIYAAGVTLYEMVSGFNPFDPDEDATQAEVIAAHLHVEPAPLDELDPDVPESLSKIVATCLAKKPEDRYPTADAFALAVRAEGRRMIDSGHPLAQCYLQPSDNLPALRPAMARAHAKAVEKASPPQPTQLLPADAPRPCETADLPQAFTPAPATPFEHAALGPASLSGAEQPPSSSQPAPHASVLPRLRGKGFTEIMLPLPGSQPPASASQPKPPPSALLQGKGFTERMLPLPGSQPPASSPQPASPAQATPLLRGKGSTEAMLPLPARSHPPQTLAVPTRTPPQSTAPARDSAPVTRSTWVHPDQRAKDNGAPAPPRVFEPGTLSRKLLLFAPAIGLVLAALVLMLGSVLPSAWEPRPSPAAPLAPSIDTPPPAPATVAATAEPSVTPPAPGTGAPPSEIASPSAPATPSPLPSPSSLPLPSASPSPPGAALPASTPRSKPAPAARPASAKPPPPPAKPKPGKPKLVKDIF